MSSFSLKDPIIIVGAGIAGLRVAEGLLDRGAADVTVLERYPNVGGRVVTNRTTEGGQYEIGAGRIHRSHRRVGDLVRRFGFHTYPIASDLVWRPVGSASSAADEPHGFGEIWSAIHAMLVTLPPAKLAKHTVMELLPRDWHPLLLRFPYRAELDVLRADVALEVFGAEMGTYDGYYGVVEGLDAITRRLAEAVEAKGGHILVRHRVADIRRVLGSKGKQGRQGPMFEIVGDFGKKAEAKPFTIQCSQLIIATCRCSLGSFNVLKRHPVLQQVQTSPLTRIYAKYPREKGHVWWEGIQKTVTDSPLRFVIPIDPKTGLIMISYTDGRDTDVWKHLDGDTLKDAIQAEVRRLWSDRRIPEPTYLQKHEWPGGCSYWVPGTYDVTAAQAAAINPSQGLFVVGESIARHQAWIESALEVADMWLEKFTR